MLKQIPADLLVINPDCACDNHTVQRESNILLTGGLKTRGWKETEASLTNLVEAAKVRVQ